jgi:predicted permease
MLFEILDIVAPVFLVVGAGYTAVKTGLSGDGPTDQLMKFAIKFAIPCLLFRATSTIDLAAAFDWRIIFTYYTVAISSFVVTFLLATRVFRHRPGEGVAVGFSALFSNLVLLGLPISERAWGADSLAPNYALVAVNAPICYLIGITAMEYLRADGRGPFETTRIVFEAMFRNSLMIGIGLGFIVNLGGIPVPGALSGAIDLLARASLPVALFALGGVLTRYTMKESFAEALAISALSLIAQPALTLLIAKLFGLPDAVTKSIVLMAAMAPGLNAYLFANMYNRSVGVTASTVLLSTILSVFSVSAWLIIL